MIVFTLGKSAHHIPTRKTCVGAGKIYKKMQRRAHVVSASGLLRLAGCMDAEILPPRATGTWEEDGNRPSHASRDRREAR